MRREGVVVWAMSGGTRNEVATTEEEAKAGRVSLPSRAPCPFFFGRRVVWLVEWWGEKTGCVGVREVKVEGGGEE